jgi:peptide/nickel transport system permease protein
MTQDKNQQGVQFKLADIITIVVALALLIAFAALPWMQRPSVKPTTPGVNALVADPGATIFGKLQEYTLSTNPVYLNDDTLTTWFHLNASTNMETGWELVNDPYFTSQGSGSIIFIPIAALGALIMQLITMGFPTKGTWRILALGAALMAFGGLVLNLFSLKEIQAQSFLNLAINFVFGVVPIATVVYFISGQHRLSRLMVFIFGVFGLLHFGMVSVTTGYADLSTDLGIGFWITFALIGVLIVQVFFRREPKLTREDLIIQPKGIVNEDGVLDLSSASSLAGESLYSKAFKRLRRDYLTIGMLMLVFLLVAFSLSAPLLEQGLGVSYTDTRGDDFLPIDSGKHLLGTDDLGRDHLARLAYAGQITLAIAFAAALLSLVIGVILGIITGYYGGIVDDVIMWFITTLNSIPQLFLLIIITAVLRPGPEALILVFGLLGWTGTTRLVRGETLALREREYVVSARALGASDVRIMFNHIMPNLLSIVVVTLALDIGVLMLSEAALSYLGLGVQPPTPTWGNMLSNSQTFFNKGGHLVIFPGLFISITVLAFYVIGDGLRDAFDPRTND